MGTEPGEAPEVGASDGGRGDLRAAGPGIFASSATRLVALSPSSGRRLKWTPAIPDAMVDFRVGGDTVYIAGE